MTGLLVSVRNSTEAQAALRGGADLIDIKEPRAGSLGSADVQTWREVSTAVGTERPLSVAMGELQDGFACDLARQTAGMQFAKIGLAGCRDDSNWSDQWHDVIRCLPTGVASVGVIYADNAIARAPTPAEILGFAIHFRCAALLFDTYSKSGENLFDHLDEHVLRDLLRDAKEAGMTTVLGGSLRGELVRRALELEPDYIAVRGAVCHGDRSGAIDRVLIESLAEFIHA